MMESRSFDHLLGYLRLKQVLPIDGLKGGEQLSRGNQGFVANDRRQRVHAAPPDPVMGYHDETQVWAYDYLARNFALCDRWFSSVPGPTVPNRLFAVAGWSGGETDNPRGVRIYEGVRTVFDCLDDALRDRPRDERWGYYFHDLPMLALLKQHLDEFRPGLPRRVVNFLTGWTPRIRKVDAFFERARAGRLPAVSWIDPSFAGCERSNGDHPPTSDLYDGQALVARVYDAILNGGADLWARTLLVFLYAEHGGFYDHVFPSASGDPAPFDRFGVRVPAIVVSAWTPPVVDGGERDHTCLLRTILDRFAPGERLTPRVARAASLHGLVSLPFPRRDAAPIPVPERTLSVLVDVSPATATTRMEDLVRAFREELKQRKVMLD